MHVAPLAHKHSRQAGFSLIEVMIVMVLLSILMTGATSLFLMNTRASIRTSIRQDIKEEGLFLMNQMEFILKNAAEVTTTQCNNASSSIQIKNIQDQIVTITSNALASGPPTGTISIDDPTYGNQRISSDSIDVQEHSTGTPLFECITNSTGEKFVEIKFRLTRSSEAAESDISETPVSEDFSRLVQLRN